MAAHWLYCAAAPGAYTGLDERAASYTQGARHSLGSEGAQAGSWWCRVSSSGCDSVPAKMPGSKAQEHTHKTKNHFFS